MSRIRDYRIMTKRGSGDRYRIQVKKHWMLFSWWDWIYCNASPSNPISFKTATDASDYIRKLRNADVEPSENEWVEV